MGDTVGNGYLGSAAPRLPAGAELATAGDLDLLQRCLVGDEDAWGRLVSRYERLVFSIALREGLTREDAHDATQMVFEALLGALGNVRSADSLGAWLAAVTRRQAWRLRERAARERPVEAPDSWGERTAVAVDEDPIDELERAIMLYRGLEDLGEPCRSLLLALYFDPARPSYSEVAVRLGRPVGSIGPTRARCLERLRELLGGDWP
jgi:RNA polymerase sigma factor (sigma-70 family)